MPKLSFTISEFCDANAISRSTFYDLVKCGQGPALMLVGKRTFISTEAAEDWRRKAEQRAAARTVQA